MRIKYKQPWTINPDPISYQVNSGDILSFNNSETFFFYIDFNLPFLDRSTGKVDEYSNIVWKGNDELGIQLVDNKLVFTVRIKENSEIVNKEYELTTDNKYKILITGNSHHTHIYINDIKEFEIVGDTTFTNNSTYNFGGGHGDNIEYDLNFLSLGTVFLEDNDTTIIDPTLPNVLGYYTFDRVTEEKVWDHSCHFNLLNRFYL